MIKYRHDYKNLLSLKYVIKRRKEGQCLGGKLPDTANVTIQIGGTQVHERYATKQNDFDEKKVLYRDIDDDIQMSEFALQNNVPLELADLSIRSTVGP
ncbi:unnamed protein product [Rotaria socialis]|uniref:Uncharacterized protein n=1 Tax=Rotaria socialis TaxID=392032 RepID=A0A821QM62_9BILA|nr:unnamed protein product [Rotaria socialis]